MAERGRRTADDGRERRYAGDPALVRVCDLAGRPRGTGFVADHHGTVITSHETVDGLARLVLHAPGDRTCVVGADAVTPLPYADLALVRTEGLGLEPLPVSARDRLETGTYVRIAAGGWREARVLGTTPVTYTANDCFHLLDAALELAIGTTGRDALRLGGGAAGGPVLDPTTGAVLAVLGTALQTGHRTAGYAVPLRGVEGPLEELLACNAATVPAYGVDLNLAGVLELAATSVGSDGPVGVGGVAVGSAGTGSTDSGTVERADVVREFAAFTDGSAAVLALVGAPGSGRTTELAALAERRGRGPEPAPTLWLRGADLQDTDASLADAAVRALERAGRIVAASGVLSGGGERGSGAAGGDDSGRVAGESGDSGRVAGESGDSGRCVASRGGGAGVLPVGGCEGELGDIGPERLARLAQDAGRPLLLLLDGPEEMPPALAHRLPEWIAGTADWLRETGARLVVACRAEYWEQAGAEFPAELLHGAAGQVAYGGGQLPPCVWLGDLGDGEARRARARYGIPEGALSEGDARHPLTLRLLAEVRGALPVADGGCDAARGGGAAERGVFGGRPSGDGAADGRSPERGATVGWPTGGDEPPRPPAPGANATVPPDRNDVFSAYLDLMCLRIAVRLAAANGVRGSAVRRLAARVSGQVHEAARRCLGPRQGELDREIFEAVFPWGPAPERLGGTGGWASAVLTEGLLVPAGNGYRFAHEELADWIQGTHLDLDAALHALVHRDRAEPPAGPGDHPATAAARRRARAALRAAEPAPLPVPRHRIGPVVQALLLLGRQQGPAALSLRLEDLLHAVDVLLPPTPAPPSRAAWWGIHLLTEVLLRVPDATPYLRVLRLLTEQIVRRRAQGRGVPGEFGPWFWEKLPVGDAERFDLLRRLVVADGAPQASGATDVVRQTAFGARHRTSAPESRRGTPTSETPRYLDAVSRLLADRPAAVQPHLTRWFDDERPLPATPHATVATAAQALLHTHRRRALDDLAEALVDSAHRRGDELLAVLAEEEPSAVCRAVDRWAHDPRPARRVAAVAYGLRAAPHVRTEADRELLRYAALALLARPADCTLHGGALALLVRDPRTRARHLPGALARFTAGDPQLPASALLAALTTHPEPVLTAFQTRLQRSGPDVGETLRALADVTTPALARRVAVLVREVVEQRPEAAAHVAAYVDRRLEHGLAARAVLLPLVSGLLDGGPTPVRAALAAVLAAPGGQESRPLRRELLELLLRHERDPAVLDALVRAAADGAARTGEEHTRGLVHRAGQLLVRTPDGATRFDRGLVDLARRVPGFAPLVAGWLTGAPDEWAAVVGPSSRRMIENLAGVRVPA